MVDLNFILFISIAAPLLMMLLVCRDRTRDLLLFVIMGTVVCLICGELNTFVCRLVPFSQEYCVRNITPLIEELMKAFPILVFAFIYEPSRRALLENAIAVGIGFAILENAIILGGANGQISLFAALLRGFGSGMMHGICTLLVGLGLSFVHFRKKLFVTGTIALLSVAVVYHSMYNCFISAGLNIVALLLPTMVFVPVEIKLRSLE